MYKKEENFKEKFRQALISTAKVISDDYKPLKNKKKKLDTNSFELLELEDLNDINDFIKFRAESDSALNLIKSFMPFKSSSSSSSNEFVSSFFFLFFKGL